MRLFQQPPAEAYRERAPYPQVLLWHIDAPEHTYLSAAFIPHTGISVDSQTT